MTQPHPAISRIEDVFAKTISKYSSLPADLIRSSFPGVLAAYMHEKRHFQNIIRLMEMFEVIEDLNIKFENPDAVHLAIIFHGIIYDPARFDVDYDGASSAQESAEYARNFLQQVGCPPEFCDRVHDLIILTDAHTANFEDQDELLFLDLGNAIYGMDRQRYQEYVLGTYKEFLGAFDAGDIAQIRTLALENMLAANRIFQTDVFEEAFGTTARENMQWEQGSIAGMLAYAQTIEQVSDLYARPTPPM